MTDQTIKPADCWEHCGPPAAKCAVCGGEIAAYESRSYGPTGAACVDCVTKENEDLFPFYYTDG